MKHKLGFFILALTAFVYLLVRTITVPLSHDEIATFYFYIQPFEYNFFDGAQPDANNHILNSFLSGISFKFFGFSSLSLRLPNLLSFVLFLFYVYKIGDHLKHLSSKWWWYIGMLFAVNFIQFFGMTRGYGLSMAFLIASSYYMLNLHKGVHIKSLVSACFFICLALLSNLSLMYVSLIFFAFIAFHSLRFFKDYLNNFKKLAVLFLTGIISLLVLWFCLKTSFFLKENGLLYYGTLDGFWELTVKSMLLMFFEDNSMIAQLILIVFLAVLLIVYLIRFTEVKIQSFVKPSFFYFWVLLGTVLAIQVLAHFMKVNYPEDRVGLYLYPLLIGAFIFGIDRITLPFLRTYLPVFLLIIPFYAVTGGSNLHYFSYIPKDSTPKRFYNTIQNAKNKGAYPVTVGGYKLRSFTYVTNLYGEQKNGNLLQMWDGLIYKNEERDLEVKQHPGMYADFLIAEKAEIKDILYLYDSIDYDKTSGQYLFKRNQEVELSLRKSIADISTNGENYNEFFDLFRDTLINFDGEGLFLGVNLHLKSWKQPFRGRVVCDVTSLTTGSQISYDFIPFDWLKFHWDKDDEFLQSLYLTNIPENEKVTVTVYLWNVKKDPFVIDQGKVELFKIMP